MPHRTHRICTRAAPTLVLALLAACTLTMAQAAPLPSPRELACQLQAARQPSGQVTLQFTLRNTGTRSVHLLRWGSPFEAGWFGPFVRVSTAQGELRFQGAMKKRGDPSAGDYLLLRAGQSLAAELVLNDAFALPPAGTLQITAGWRWHDAFTDGTAPRARAQHQALEQACGSLTLAR